MRRHLSQLRYHVSVMTERKAEIFWVVAYFTSLAVTALHWWTTRQRDMIGTFAFGWALLPIPLLFMIYRYRYEVRAEELTDFEREHLTAAMVAAWLFWIENVLIANKYIYVYRFNYVVLVLCIAHYVGLMAVVLSSFEEYNQKTLYPGSEDAEGIRQLTPDERAQILRDAIANYGDRPEDE